MVYDFIASGEDTTALENEFPGITKAVLNGSLSAIGMKAEDGNARWTEKRIDELYTEYSSDKSGSDDYAKAYAAILSPSDFLSLTATSEDLTAIELDTATKDRYNHGNIDAELLGNVDAPRLYVNLKTGQVENHEGRHRMSLLSNAGIDSVSVVIVPYSQTSQEKYHTKIIPELSLKGQSWHYGEAPGNVTVTDITPFSTRNRTKIESQFGGDAQVRFSQQLPGLDELSAENEALRNEVEYWKGQTKLTKPEERTVRRGDIDKLAKRLIKSYGSTLKAEDISGELAELGDYIVRGGDEGLTWSEVKTRAVSIARELIQNADRLNDDLYREYSDLRRYLRETELVLGAEYHADINDFNNFRKRNFGRMRLKTRGETNVDRVYGELAEMWPGFFGSEAIQNPADQLMRIADVLDALQPVYENPYSADMAEATEYAANDIIDEILSDTVRQTPPTAADRLVRQAQEKAGKALERERERREKQVARLKEHYKQVDKRRRELAADSRARTRLLNIARRLNNKKLPAVTRELLQRYIGELDLVAKSMTGKTLENLTELEDWYRGKVSKNSDTYDPDFLPDKTTLDALERLHKKQIADLTPDEVAELTNALLNIENEIRTQRRLIDSQVKHDTYIAGEQAITDIENSKGSRGGLIDTLLISETLSPTRELHRVTGYVDDDPLYIAAQELADGQRKMFDYQRRANERFKRWLEDKKFVQSIAGEKAKEIAITGIGRNGPLAVTITPAMRMSLYLHSLNNDNLRHIAGGGITVPDIELYKKGKLMEAYDRGVKIKLTPSEVRKIAAGMSEEERAFARAARDYFNGQSRDEINATSELLKGYSIAGVENYFPINTDSSFLKTDFDSIKYDGTIEGMGFLKERASAANPIMLYDLNSVLTKSISQHSKYVGLAIPVRNFNKLWGVTTASFNEDGSRNNFESSVQKAVKEKWGQNAYAYVEKLMTDLNNPAEGQNSWARVLASARSRYAKAVLELNASVAVKQAASYPTAAAVVGFGPLIKALADTRKPNLDLIARYTPLLWYRSQGYSSQELGEIAQRGKSLPKGLSWIQAIDVATTTKLWKAAEYYVRDTRKDLTYASDAFYKETARVYNRIIEETQPNYSVMQRPALLRSNNELVRSLNMFKTQPFQNFNILYDAIENMNAKRKAYINDSSEANKNAFAEARKAAARAITSQAVSAFVFALMQFAWDLFRRRDDKYKDKDGEYTVGSWMKGMGFNMLSNGFGMFPFGTEILEGAEVLTDRILKELDKDPFFDAQYYGVDVSTVSMVNDTVQHGFNSIVQTIAAIQAAASSHEKVNWESYIRTLYQSAADIAQLTGMPLDNVRKTVSALAEQTLVRSMGKYVGGYYALRITSDPTKYSGDYYDLLYKAYNSTDSEAYEEVYRLMSEERAFTEDGIKTAMEKRMKDAAGVKKVSELENRYLSPSQQDEYDAELEKLRKSGLWSQATDGQKKDTLDILYGLTVGSNSSAVKSARSKIEGGADVGLDEAEYLLYLTALGIADANGNNNGRYTKDEVEAALRSLDGLSSAEKDYLRQS